MLPPGGPAAHCTLPGREQRDGNGNGEWDGNGGSLGWAVGTIGVGIWSGNGIIMIGIIGIGMGMVDYRDGDWEEE